jgi:Concanavalin A-like lectin/glucanases superfamily
MAGVWYHIAGTYDRAAMKIYINGQLDGELAATGVLFHDVCTAYWSIGAVYDRCSTR